MSAVPHLVVSGSDAAAAFYRNAFGAEEIFRIPDGDGRILRVECGAAGGKLFLCDRQPDLLGGADGPPPLEVDDCDAAFDRAVAAGAKGVAAPANRGADRCARVADPFGHEWSLTKRAA